MASYFFRSKHLSRGKGARVTRAAAYRAGERIRDERTSEVYNHSNRDDVADKDIVLPSQIADREDMSWARDRSTLWNAAEHAGRRRNSRLARELLVLLPPELTPAQRTHLIRTFSQELADKYGGAVDYTIHKPRRGADQRNHHAHLLMTTREITPDGLGPRTTLELTGIDRRVRGLGNSKAEYLLLRARWAQVTNQALSAAGIAARVDHRSLKDQGINREPTPTIPEKVFYAEQRSGIGSPAGDAIRARYRERVEAREKGGDELARVLQKQKEELRQRAVADLTLKDSLPKKVRWASLTRDERNQIRRQQYAAGHEKRAQDPVALEKKRAAGRRYWREAMQTRRAEIREKQNQWRQANADKVNRNQREYRKANAEELNRKKREYRKARRERQAALSHIRPSPTAEESARNWLTYRQTQDPAPTAEQSAKNWLALRESRQQPDTARTTPNQPLRTSQPTGHGVGNDEDDDATKKPNRSRDHDFGL